MSDRKVQNLAKSEPRQSHTSPVLLLIVIGGLGGLGFAVYSLFVNAEAVILRDFLPSLELAVGAIDVFFERVVGGAELGNCLFCQKFFQCPLLDRMLLVIPQLGDVADCVGQNGPFVLLAPGNNLC